MVLLASLSRHRFRFFVGAQRCCTPSRCYGSTERSHV
jgi:hypothetical protein